MDMKESYKLVVFGDSITKGVIYDNEKSRYSNLKDCFVNLIGDSVKGTVHNAGRFGSTIMRGVGKMYNDVMKKTPDIVLIEFGGNDCDFNWDDIAHHPDTEHKPNTEIFTFRDTLLNMIATLRKADITPVLMTLPPLDSNRYFKWVTKGDASAEQNVLHFLGSEIEIFNWHNLYNETIAEVADKTRTLLIDVKAEFLKYRDYSRFLCVDGIHPNVEGHSLIADVVLHFFKDNYNFLLQGN
jgi:lysophospholipase L1-like esterase